jgi:eukaryotic-like serine/threonine-protein kinase
MREQSIFIEALEKYDPADRAAFLDEVCGGDTALRQRIERLLRRDQQADSLLDSPTVAHIATIDEPVTERPGTVIGPYKLLEQIGEGGFGVVFMAEQIEPIRRKVALKVLKAGMDTRQVIARFEAERQALALMDHPNIAHVLEAGETSSGRPYFVMELVRGLSMTDYCDQTNVPIRERLALFIDVCQAVQHAHQKGIIHRDIKPSNVLVTLHDGKPVVKVIDFGIAKAMGQQLTDKTLFTNFAQMIGTPLYMSPEQAALSGLDVDTRSDIYSLGVLLYELLTGTTPFEKKRFKEAGYDEIRRIIREEEPAKPSTRMSNVGQAATTASDKRRSDPRKLSRLFRGELDWIVMKALEKDRNRRYETASALAADVEHYLADEPVLACPPSRGYRLRKLLRKHRALVASVAAPLAVALFALTAGLFVLAAAEHRERGLRKMAQENEQKAQQKEQEAHDEKAKAEAAQRQALDALRATTDEVILKLIGSKPALGPAEKKFLEKALERWQTFALERGDGEIERAIRAEGLFRVAQLRQTLGQKEEGIAAYKEAVDLLIKLAAEFPATSQYRGTLAASHYSLGVLLAGLGKQSEAESAFRESLRLLDELAIQSPDEPEFRRHLAHSHSSLGLLLSEQPGRQAEAEAAYGRALDLQEKRAADFPNLAEYQLDLADSYTKLGLLFADLGKQPEAEAPCRKALAIRSKLARDFPTVSEYSLSLAYCDMDLASLLAQLGKRPEAEEASRRALAIFEYLVGAFPAVPGYQIGLGGSQCYMGNRMRDQNHPGESLDWFAKAIATLEGVLRYAKIDIEARKYLCDAHWGRAQALDDLKRHAEAAGDWEKAVQLSLALEKTADPNTLYNAACLYARVAGRRGEPVGSLSKEDCAKHAVALLQQAVAKRYKDAEVLKKDDHLKALRERDDFKELVSDLEAAKAKNKPDAKAQNP